ncbi:MAG: diaminopropionate ammonia-lyase [Burkholderiaceae bacterium]|nr:diaminopropionate ammonia-lyase [Burkholderiaceae bacterium]
MTEPLLLPSDPESRIRHAYGRLSEAERKLADLVLGRGRALLGYSATELAGLAGTSKSTAARFFRSLGYAGYGDFRQAVRAAQVPPSPLERMEPPRRKEGLGEQFKAHLRDDALRLQEWAETLPDAQMEAALERLSRARKVWVVGYRHSHVTAFYAQALLSQVRGDVLTLNDAAGREADLLASASDKDVVLAVDFRRRSLRLPRTLAAARSAGAQVLVLTDAPFSALALQAQVVLRCAASHPQGLFDSYVCAMSVVNFLAAALAQRQRHSTHQRLERIERLHVALNDLESLGATPVVPAVPLKDRMTAPLPFPSVTCLINPARDRSAPYGPHRQAILGAEALARAEQELSQWEGHAPTPLHRLPALAEVLDVAEVHYKDEGGRFGLGSFKALGGAYAVARLLCRELGARLGRTLGTRDLLSPAVRAQCAEITVTCATDGNHGRSVAWGAQRFGCRCVIYVHATVSEGREQAIAHYGAEVVRTPGNYDDAVRQADADARAHGRFVISDTSYPGYMDVPRDVMQGYQLMVHEAAQALAQRPTHVFVQAGVGGLAAAVCAYFWERDGGQRPTCVVVEPDRADCLMQSARAGQLTAVTGDIDTLMAGLACGEVSHLAWDILEPGADAFCVIPDAAAPAAMRLMAHPLGRDPVVVAGESAVAGVAAAVAACQDLATRAALGLTAESRLLFFGSESATDPALYAALVGESAASVAARAAAQDRAA